MQTFLPYPDFVVSARCLDYRRLGKQRLEAKQLINIIESGRTTGGWANHPACRMWRGYLDALCAYYNACIDEWVRRGYNNTMPREEVVLGYEYPPWFGDEAFHASHRSNLLRKNTVYYGQFHWPEKDDLPYVWPV